VKFEVTILGCGSATPTITRKPTAQVVNVREHYFLFDCGEGTQVELRRNNIKFQRINQKFIRHLHGDHFSGLLGVISSIHLLGRTTPLQVFGPPGLEDIVLLQLKLSHSYLSYALEFVALEFDGSQIIYENEQLSISRLPLKHSVPCNGFLLREKPKQKNILKEKLTAYQIPIAAISSIKDGGDFTTEDGRTIPNKELTKERAKSYSYAFCSDTAYTEHLIPLLKDVDVLYHESTFLEAMRDRAKATKHSTAKDAAEIASKAGVKQLVLGHYSARYKTTEEFLEEALPIFENTILGHEGKVIRLY